MWASQVTGKTETLNNIIGHKIDVDPCPMLMVQYSIEMGETWSKDRLAPMLRDTPRLRNKVREARVRDSGNTIMHKRFPGGHLTVAGANSAASLASRPVRVVICDEVDRYPASAGTEGDPVMLAEKRTESFPDATIILVSTPGTEGTSRIEKAYNTSDKRMWFCPCPKCGVFQTLKWGQVKWENADPTTATYICEANACVWDDSMRQQAVKAGEWRATAPFTGTRGYQMNGIYTLFRPKKPHKNRLAQMVSEFLKANSGGEQQQKVWINTFLAETWKVKGESVDVKDLTSRCELYRPSPLPEGALVIVGAADVQADRIEATIVACGERNEIWALQHAVLMGNTDADPVWKALDDFTLQEFEHQSGSKLRVACFLVDMGFRPKQVIKFTKPRQGRRVYACAGNKTPWAPLVSRPSKTTNRQATKFQIGGDTAKEVLYDRLRSVTAPGPRYIHFPIGQGFDEEYFKQLAAETLITELDDRGIERKRIWVKQRSRNEALDNFVYILGAIDVLKPNFEALAKGLAIKPEKGINTNADAAPPEPPTPERAPAVVPNKRAFPVRRSGGGGGWVNGWRR
jgi:phage terminase large subunit GpA-like protein